MNDYCGCQGALAAARACVARNEGLVTGRDVCGVYGRSRAVLKWNDEGAPTSCACIPVQRSLLGAPSRSARPRHDQEGSALAIVFCAIVVLGIILARRSARLGA
jgi:hypothetical protein